MIKGTRSPSCEIPSTTQLSALVEILNADNFGAVSILVRNCVTVATSTSLFLFSKLREKFAKVKLYL